MKKNNSNNGMIPSTWGPSLWHFLHTISFNYPEQPTKKHMQKYFNLINSLTFTLPCKLCRDNFISNLEKMKFYEKKNEYFKDRKNFSKFIFDIHNLVNKDTEKKEQKNYKVVKDKYEQYRYIGEDSDKKKKCKVVDISK